MNDRFKFRVWDKERKCFFNDEEVVIYPNGEESFFNADYDFAQTVVNQCTGLKDKNGNLIYEGDILGGVFESLYIDWCDECRQFCLKDPLGECMACLGDMHWCDLVEDDGKIEVIGNIHENKELIQ